ncbi:MAG TPA: hypothetical protein VNE39_27585 [Planctomycetota bacterium]|nr:hypothetical protein [Planctomycetota bacterium]
MTLGQDYACALARAFGIAAGAVLMGVAVRAAIASCPRRLARLLWLVHIVPFLTPVLLVGYAWSRYASSLIHYPAWNQALYTLLVWLRLTPVATLILHFAPSAMSPEATWCHKLLGKRMGGCVDGWMNVGERQSSNHPFLQSSPLLFWLHSSGRAFAVAFVVVFLLAFGEFEMASLLCIPSWTVTLFDAQAGGLALGESLRMAAPGLLIGVALLGLGLWLLFTAPTRGIRPAPARSAMGRAARSLVGLYLLAALAVATLLPAWLVLEGAARGLGLLPETLALAKEVMASVVFGLAAAACAYWLSVIGCRLSGCRCAIAAALCIPGLLGALVLALLILALFQLPGLRAAYDTPIPLVVALTLLLLPFALVLRMLVSALRPGEASHAARLLTASSESKLARGGRRVLWHLEGQGKLAVAFLLFCWGYFDLTASAILAPSQMAPVIYRLYNFMHYGQTAALSTMVLVCFAVPFLLCGLFFASFRVLRG